MPRTIEFHISRTGALTADGECVGSFGSAAAASEAAIRFAQEGGHLYRIFYPL